MECHERAPLRHLPRTARMIVDCAAYANGERVTGTLSLHEVPEWLAKPEVFVWLGLRMPDAAEMTVAAQTFGLHDLDCNAAVAPHDRPVVDRARAMRCGSCCARPSTTTSSRR